MQIGALGDIHGEFDTVDLIMQRHADIPLWVCVGDVASNDGEYFAPRAPLYFIKGNNEDFDVQRRTAYCRAVARRRSRRDLRAQLVSLVRGCPAAVEGPQVDRGLSQARQEPGRQASSFRPR